MKNPARQLNLLVTIAVTLVITSAIVSLPSHTFAISAAVADSSGLAGRLSLRQVNSFASGSTVTQKQAVESFGKMPLYFIENRGQLDKRVEYYIQGSDEALYFDNKGVTFVKTDKVASGSTGEKRHISRVADRKGAGVVDESQSSTLRLQFIGSNTNARPIGEDLTPATISYFKGTQENWNTGLKTYSTLVYANLWPGIDLIYTGNVNRLKYTFLIKPGADPKQIKMAYHGARGVNVSREGQLEVKTRSGIFVDEKPYSYQDLNEGRAEVATRFALSPARRGSAPAVGFKLGDYDKSKLLVLDPAAIVYAGFIGSSQGDEANGIALDFDQNAYIIGTTSVRTFGMSNEANFSTVPQEKDAEDAFVAKLNKNGALAYVAFIGGNRNDSGNAIAVDLFSGEACIVGTTGPDKGNLNGTFPFKVGPHALVNRSDPATGSSDAFVAKLNSSGTDLLFSGLIGGVGNDLGQGVTIDDLGDVYVTGSTQSDETTFPSGVGFVDAFGQIPGADLTYNGPRDRTQGRGDAFVAKVLFDGSILSYATYIGGAFGEEGHAIAVDSQHNAYITGTTHSIEFPGLPLPAGVVISGDLQTRHTTPATEDDGTAGDAFVVKLADGGEQALYKGFISGKNVEEGKGIAVDSNGDAYVTGSTNSSAGATGDQFPAKPGFGPAFKGGLDAFVAKVVKTGDTVSLQWAGYIGGSADDVGLGIGLEDDKNVYVTGSTNSTKAGGFPVVNVKDLKPENEGSSDAFLTKLKADGARFLYSGFLGGTGADEARAIAVTVSGKAFIAGVSAPGTGFPTKTAPKVLRIGGKDAFAAKIEDLSARPSPTNDLGFPGQDFTIPVPVGNIVTVPITVRNFGPNAATDILLTDSLPASLTFVSASSPTGFSNPGANNSFTVLIPSLAGGASETVSLNVLVNCSLAAGTVITNTPTVSSSATDSNPSNNSITLRLTAFNPTLNLSCPPNVVQSVAMGQASAVVNYTQPGINGNCSGASIICSPPSGSSFPLGDTTVSCSASNSRGEAATCSFTVNVALFEFCLQDESNGNLLMLNPTTGDYQFTNCSPGGITLTGRGTISRRGCTLILQDTPSDRRVLAYLDTCAKTGKGSVEIFSPSATLTVMDRNTNDNTCSCP